MSDASYVRKEMAHSEPAPASQAGAFSWVRNNLFASVGDTVMTAFILVALFYCLPPLINWVIIHAQWTGADRSVCATIAQGGIQPNGWSGACWAFVNANILQFVFGRYPVDERWRVVVTTVLFVALLVPLLIPRVPHKVLNAALLFLVFPILSFFLLVGGGWTGLQHVETSLWGGLLVTMVLSVVGISVSVPFGILLALGRRSKLPAVKILCVIFIETIRGVPLVIWLFMASIMLPLFLPPGTTIDKFLRALVGVSLFVSAYMAEVIRGGLQAIAKGQYEGADSLGLGYWQKTRFIILPQALKLVIPGIVNTFIGMFKDTSLVYIIGMFDLLGIVKQNFANAAWASPQTPISGLVFAGLVFWLFCFGMSRYSNFVERRLDTGHKR